jgi:hypothetical protein
MAAQDYGRNPSSADEGLPAGPKRDRSGYTAKLERRYLA